jgi:pimeloyl-ACP methyl ester carboxylesterase
MKQVLLLSILSSSVLFSACIRKTEMPVVEKSERGEVISATLVHNYSKAQCDSILATKGLNGLLESKSGIKVYKISYKTIDWNGKPTFAGGMYYVPDMPGTSLDFASYQHGTIADKKGAPSYEGTEEIFIGIAFAADMSLAVQLPDYLGLGDSPGLHPYMHAATEASATIDMMRATRQFSTENNITLSGKNFLFGYSQGGHATMAAVREIETNLSKEFTVTASAPLSGPYNTSGVQADVIIKDEAYPSPGYLPYILFSYNQCYNLFSSPNHILKDTFASFLPEYFNGEYGMGDIDAAVPAVPNKIIRTEVLDTFKQDMNHRFRKALRDNDLIDWTPKAPMMMCAGTADKHVSYQNAMIAYYSFINRGATQVRPPVLIEGADHGGAVQFSLFYTRAFFDEFR